MTSNRKTDKSIAKKYKQKKFFGMVFNSILCKGGNFKEGHYVRIYQANEELNIVKFFNNIDELVGYTSGNNYNVNTYFTIASTDGEGGTEQNLKTHNVIALDFDKKELGQDFSITDIIHRFKDINLWYHAVVDSGHGYHVYVCIEPTEDSRKVSTVSKRIATLIGADLNAVKTTQILRVPGTYNIKQERKKLVKVVKQYEADTIKRYNIDELYQKFCTDASLEHRGSKSINYTIKNTNIPQCIVDILENGSTENSRYDDLLKIVVTLRKRNKTIPEIKQVCKEWAAKSGYDDFKVTGERVEKIYESLNHVTLPCGTCHYKDECFNKVESDFNHDDNILGLSETVIGKLKKSNRKNAKTLGGNEILIYTILTNHNDGLFREELVREITYKGKPRFSDNTLTKTLNNLEEQGLITAKGKPRFYKIVKKETKIELIVNMSYAAAYEAVKGTISTEELRLYYYMRFIHSREQRENPKALKGNLFQINQSELAEDLGVSQSRISQMIQSLETEKLLSIWNRQKSKNNGFEFYIYRLNY